MGSFTQHRGRTVRKTRSQVSACPEPAPRRMNPAASTLRSVALGTTSPPLLPPRKKSSEDSTWASSHAIFSSSAPSADSGAPTPQQWCKKRLSVSAAAAATSWRSLRSSSPISAADTAPNSGPRTAQRRAAASRSSPLPSIPPISPDAVGTGASAAAGPNFLRSCRSSWRHSR